MSHGRRRDSQAVEELIRAVESHVFFHCKKFLKREEDAQDTSQEVLLTMSVNLDNLGLQLILFNDIQLSSPLKFI